MRGLRSTIRTLTYPFMSKTPYRIETDMGVVGIPHVDAYSRQWLRRSRNSIHGWHEPSLTWFLMVAGGKGGKRVFVDAGSHLGYFSFVHTRRTDNRAIAIELNPSIFDIMSKMIIRSDSHGRAIKAVNVGLSSRPGRIRIPSEVSLSPSFSLDFGGEHMADDRSVELETLDGLVAARGLEPDLIKIDVEGAEFEVLLGAQDTLRRSLPVVAIELHPALIERMSGRFAIDLVAHMHGLGYREFQFVSGRSRTCTPLKEGYEPEISDNPNLVFVAGSDADLISIYNSTLEVVNGGAFPDAEKAVENK